MCRHCMDRRAFLGTSAGLAVGAALFTAAMPHASAAPVWAADRWDPDRPLMTIGKPLRIQPLLMYRIPQPREMASWKSWGGIQDIAAVDEEAGRIAGELAALAEAAEFPVEVLPVLKIDSPEAAKQVKHEEADVTIIYPATGSGTMLLACVPPRGAIVFVRHLSGPVYYWYEALSTRYLRKRDEAPTPEKPLSVHDVVVDDPDELMWRLRALYGVKNFVGSRIIALGGAGGKYASDAPEMARENYKLDIVEVGYDVFGPRIEAAIQDTAMRARAEEWTRRYLELPGTELQTDREFVVNAFILYGLFKDLMEEHGASAFTINSCMGAVIPISKTTACLTLSLMNDEGLIAFCESDFVVVPAGMLLRQIASKPVFMHNSTFPHDGVVTCAHCTGPRRMDATHYEPTLLLTHYESEFGVAPKVTIPPGQEVSFINPEYTTGRWVGLRGTVEGNPFLEICRSQQDVRIHGQWKRLLDEVRDSHWMMVYGDYLREVGYATERIGIAWDNISEA